MEKVRALHAQEEAFLAQLDELCPESAAPAADLVSDAASEIDDNVQRLLAQAMMDATTENLKAREEEEPADLSDTAEFSPVSDEKVEDEDDEDEDDEDDFDRTNRISRINFGELQFGRDYEIK